MNRSILAWAMMAFLAAACSRQETPPTPPRPVSTLMVDGASAVREHILSGEVRARHETQLAFRIGGKIASRLVDAGASVKAGQPLARLDPTDVSLQAAQASAALAQAEADTKRFRELRAKNFISQSALDAHETALTAARAQAALARNQTDYATLRADAPGVVAATLAEPGQVVAAGTPVLTLARQGEREVAISIPEVSVGRYKVGDPAKVRLWAHEGRVYRGRVREIAPAADAATRTFPARVSVLDPDADVQLGMTASVVLGAQGGAVFLLPQAALTRVGGKPTVWVVDPKTNTVAPRVVAIDEFTGDDRVAIKHGLTAGEMVVSAGVHKLIAGETVRPVNPPGLR